MTAYDAKTAAHAVDAQAQALLGFIKGATSDITLDDARLLYHDIADAKGWLESALTLLTPGSVL